MTRGEGKTTRRIDPFAPYRYRLSLDGRAVAGWSAIAWRTAIPAPADSRTGVAAKPRPAARTLVLERGVTTDRDFAGWASAGLGTPERDLFLEVRSITGVTETAYALHRCRPLDWRALPDLDAAAATIAVERLRLAVGAVEQRS